MNPSSQQHTTRITTKKITNLFHSCSMQRRRSEFSQGVFCCFFPPGFCLPHNLPPANRNLFRNRCKSRGIGCKCRIHICPKAKLFSSKRWWLGPTHHACSTCEDLVRAENSHKQTKSSARAQTSRLTRALDQRSVVRLDARSFAWSLAPSFDVRLFARRELTKVSPPPLPTGLRKRFHVVCPHTLNLIPELDPLDPP